MCHTKPLTNKTAAPSIIHTEVLGKRCLDGDLYESDIEQLLSPLPKRTTPQFEERFEIKCPNLIHLIRDPSSSLSSIETHLEQNPHELNDVEELFHCTPLHYAVYHNRSDVVKLLCEKGANLNMQNKHGLTPILCAADKNFSSIVRTLVKFGANLKLTDNQGFSLLHKAVLSSNVDLVQFLLSLTAADLPPNDPSIHNNNNNISNSYNDPSLKADTPIDINASSDEGFTPLHQAALHGHNKIIKLLLAHGAAVDSRSRHQATPLHLASTKNHIRSAEYLLLHGAPVDAQDKSQRSALHYACLFGHANLIRLLIHNNADVNLKDRRHESPFALALKSADSFIISSFNL